MAAAALATDTGSYYHFKRWMWLQFPWIALANTKLALKLYTTTTNPFSILITDASQLSENKDNPSGTPPQSISTIKPACDPSATFKRMWMVKRNDPSQPLVPGKKPPMSQTVFNSMLKSCTDNLAPHTEATDRLVQSAYDDKVAVSLRRIAKHKFNARPRLRY